MTDEGPKNENSRKLDFEAAETLRKWPSLNDSRRGDRISEPTRLASMDLGSAREPDRFGDDLQWDRLRCKRHSARPRPTACGGSPLAVDNNSLSALTALTGPSKAPQA